MPIKLPSKAIEKYSVIAKNGDLEEYKAELIKQIKPEGIDLFLNRVLCAVYIGSEMTKGGIYLPKDTVAEDIWQGKAALVLKVGPTAFQSTTDVIFYDTVKVGEWVTFKVGNASQIEINDYPCRIISDHWIESRVPDPRWITS